VDNKTSIVWRFILKMYSGICQGIEDITKCVRDYTSCLVLLAQAYEGHYDGPDLTLWVGFWNASASKTKKNMGELHLKKGGSKSVYYFQLT
jgi:hypothetical protein